MKYTLNQLHIFLKVIELESVTLASEEIHLSQPAVSIQLKKFQDQFDLPLTEIVGRKLYVTEFGHEIAKSAKKIIDEVDLINNKTLAFKGQLVGKLNISIVSTAKYVMPFFLSDFLRENPGVELKMDVTNKSRVIESLRNNEVDFSLVSILPEQLNIETEDLLDNLLFLIGNSQIKTKNNIEKTLKDKPLIYREKGSGTRKSMEDFLKLQNIEVVNKIELTSNEAVKQAVIAGLGNSIMPLIGIKNELKNGELKILKVKGLPLKTKWSLIWLKEKRLSPVAIAFLNHIKIIKTNVAFEKFGWYKEFY